MEDFLAAVGADIDLEFVAGEFEFLAHFFGDFEEVADDFFVTFVHSHDGMDWFDRDDKEVGFGFGVDVFNDKSDIVLEENFAGDFALIDFRKN